MITALYLVHIAMDFLLAAWVCVVSQLYSLLLCELLLRSVMGQLLVGCVCHWIYTFRLLRFYAVLECCIVISNHTHILLSSNVMLDCRP